MESTRLLARAGYWLAAIFFLFPIANWMMSVWPLHLGQAQWRFGAIGGFTNAALTPLLGLFLALSVTLLANHPRVRRVLGWLCVLLALLGLLMLLSFALDYVQTRAMADIRLRQAIDLASGVALVKQVGIIVALVLMSMAGIRRSRGSGKSGRSSENIVLIPVSNTSPE